MTYDTTLVETLETKVPHGDVPECLKRDRLTSPYFPSLSRSQLALVIALGAIFLWTSMHRLNHTDLWGHLNFGRWIVQHRSLPAIDPFAAEPAAKAVVPAGWLAQVLGYETYEYLGLEGLVLAHALLVTLGVGLLMLAIWRRGAPLCWAVTGGVAYYLLALPIVGTIRPQLFGMVGAPLTLLACAALPQKRHPLFWLPVLFALWANLHGSFAMGLAMLGLCCAGVTGQVLGETRSLKRAALDERCVRMWTALLVSLVGACFNPHGPQLFWEVATFGQSAALGSISEWRSLPLVSLSGALFFGSLGLGAVALKLSPRRWELSDLLLLAVFGLATLSAMRMLCWWAAVWPFAIIPYAVAAWQAQVRREEVEVPATAMRTVQALGFVFMVLLIAPPTNNLVLNRPRGIGTAGSPETPIYVADEIARRQLQGTMVAPMDWADYIVWKQPNLLRPLVYTHVHLLDPAVWADYQQIEAGASNWLELVDKHQLRYLVISKQRQNQLAGQALRFAQGAKSRGSVLYQDQHSLLIEVRQP